MKPFLYAALLGAAFQLYAASPEISAYGAGDVNSKSPYGLTENEKVLLKNKKEVDKLGKNVGSVKIQVGTLEEQIEGIRSVLDGTNTRLGKIDKKVKNLSSSLQTTESNVTTLQKEMNELKAYTEESRTLQEENYEKIKVVLNELSSLIDSINTNYLSKSEYNKLLLRVEALEKASKEKKVKKQSAALKGKSGGSLLNEGVELFKANKLNDAQARFETLVKKNYKPARSNYYLGEIAYKKKDWGRAIKHYKKSISLYDKADYTPRLLYHTAISFDKLGEPSNANKFYNVLKANYPNSKEAKAAPSR